MIALVIPDREATMVAFDDLPERLRLAIAGADFPYDPREIAQRLDKGRRVSTVARSIERRTTR